MEKNSLSIKVLVTCFTVTMLIGYGVAFLKIIQITGFPPSLDQAALYYRGDPTSEGLYLPQSYAALLSIAHVHALSQPIMFALIGLAFCFTSVGERLKTSLIVLSFAGLLVSNATPWLVRYGAGAYVFLFPLSQFLMAPIFLFMSVVVIYELWWR
jgi:hypothetical protein